MKKQVTFWTHFALHAAFSRQSLFVLSYPRSGSSWLTRMLGSAASMYYGKPQLRLSPQVMHAHRFFMISATKLRTIYIVRDVRDCLISYANEIEAALAKENSSAQAIRESFGVSRPDLNPGAEGFVKFTRVLLSTKQVSRPWTWHVDRAIQLKLNIVRYEDLVKDPLFEMKSVMANLGLAPNENVENAVIEHQLEKERARGINVHVGKSGRWQEYKNTLWVDEVSKRAEPQLRRFGYLAPSNFEPGVR